MSLLAWLDAQVPRTANLCLDSRQLQAGDVFIACPGTAGDGRRYLAAAQRAGAAAIMVEADGLAPAMLEGVTVAVKAVSGLRRALGEFASAWYGHPSRQLAVLAVTGTNGKTSCTHWLAQALSAAGSPCGVIGTLGVRFADGSLLETGLTTPDVVTMHRVMARMVAEGHHAVAIEASSIGLEQGRLDGLQIAVAGFTNLTRDHLDVHGTMQAYEAAKAKLFAWPGLGSAVINLDDEAGRHLAATCTAKVVGYSRLERVDEARRAGIPVVQARDVQVGADGTMFTLHGVHGAEALIHTPIAGLYNVENLLLVAGMLRQQGWTFQQAASALVGLKPVPGRLEPVSVASASGPMVIVDYAHTPDALRSALASLRPMAQARNGRLVCVFGCGGDRDAGKRAPMGAVASAHADVVMVTSDNPRSEQPHEIIRQIMGGIDAVAHGAQVTVEADRARAILRAVWSAGPEDVVLLAGKGHETTQDVGGDRRYFSDAQWARLALTLPSATGISTDSRTLRAGELFVALSGDNFDGHRFLEAAAAAGACAAVVQHAVQADLPTIVLGDTRHALLRMAGAWRRRFALPVIAVTGSNGKTTTKEMIASILASWLGDGNMLATRGNLNNEIGVPLTLLQLQAAHRAAVVELGMNHPGEIAVLADAAAASIALVNNAQREHQEFMVSVEAVARENGAALTALPHDGIAVYPGDDAFTPLWDKMAGTRQRLRFGLSEGADVSAQAVIAGGDAIEFLLVTPQGSAPVRLSVAGRHNLRNALAAAACTLAAGCPLSAVAEGLSAFQAVKGRMQLRRLPDGTVLIDDTYNANPDSVRAAIEALAALPGRKALVLGDMGEVGENGPAMHREVGAYARERGIDILFGLGAATRDSVAAFGSHAVHADSPEAIVNLLVAERPAAILVKGSRFMRMERIVAHVGTQMNDTGNGGRGDAA